MPDGGGQITGNTLRHTSENSHGVYLQDSFRMTPRLTFNFGLRWDYFGVVKEKNNLFYQFDPANGGSLVQVGSWRTFAISTIPTTTTSHLAWPLPTT